MSLNHVVDVESLISSISDEAPQGSDIRADRSPTSDYYTIKDARNAARAAERSSVFGEDDGVDTITPWETVNEVADRILRNSSKDLEVAAWYLEGLIRLQGLAGLRDGLLVIQGLVNNHWGGVYPEPDEDGIETRVAPLTGLNGDGGEGTLLAPLRNLEITSEGDLGAFSYWQYLQARDCDRIEDEDKKSARIAALGYSLSDVSDTISAMSVADCRNIISTLEECLDIFKATSAKLRELCAGEAPPSSKISELLEEVTRTARFIFKEKVDAADAAEQALADQQSTEESEGSVAAASSAEHGQVVQLVKVASGAITNREDALKRLEDVAKYFRQYEPHTPLAPGLERLIQWGRMTVAELMMELIPDASARGLFSQFTGVKLDGSDSATYVAPPVAAVAPTVQETASTTPAAEPEAPVAESNGSMGW